MLNIDKLSHLKEDNNNLYQKLLNIVAAHSDDSPEVLKVIEEVSKQFNNMAEVIEYLLDNKNK